MVPHGRNLLAGGCALSLADVWIWTDSFGWSLPVIDTLLYKKHFGFRQHFSPTGTWSMACTHSELQGFCAVNTFITGKISNTTQPLNRVVTGGYMFAWPKLVSALYSVVTMLELIFQEFLMQVYLDVSEWLFSSFLSIQVSFSQVWSRAKTRISAIYSYPQLLVWPFFFKCLLNLYTFWSPQSPHCV